MELGTSTTELKKNTTNTLDKLGKDTQMILKSQTNSMTQKFTTSNIIKEELKFFNSSMTNMKLINSIRKQSVD